MQQSFDHVHNRCRQSDAGLLLSRFPQSASWRDRHSRRPCSPRHGAVRAWLALPASIASIDVPFPPESCKELP
jgi:hypothetical protein